LPGLCHFACIQGKQVSHAKRRDLLSHAKKRALFASTRGKQAYEVSPDVRGTQVSHAKRPAIACKRDVLCLHALVGLAVPACVPLLHLCCTYVAALVGLAVLACIPLLHLCCTSVAALVGLAIPACVPLLQLCCTSVAPLVGLAVPACLLSACRRHDAGPSRCSHQCPWHSHAVLLELQQRCNRGATEVRSKSMLSPLVLSYWCMQTSATGACGLELLVHAALSYWCMRP
jgi:hypothetical protein